MRSVQADCSPPFPSVTHETVDLIPVTRFLRGCTVSAAIQGLIANIFSTGFLLKGTAVLMRVAGRWEEFSKIVCELFKIGVNLERRDG